MRKLVSFAAILIITILSLSTTESSFAKSPRPPKPKLAVLEFSNKADNQWWHHGGAVQAQDVFVTELRKTGKFDVLSQDALDDLLRSKNVTISGNMDKKTGVKIGKLLGVNYLLTGAVTEYGTTDVSGGGGGVFSGKRKFVAALSAQLIDTSTGEVVWADKASKDSSSVKVSVFGVGGGVDDNRMFDSLMKPCIQQLVASLKAAHF